MEELKEEKIKKFFQERNKESNKGDFGYVAIMGGCENYSGAIKLANMSCSAIRAGCGVVRLIIPKAIVNSVSPYLLEQTIYSVPDDNSYMIFDKDEIDKALDKIKALAIGMGWGQGKDNERLLEYILKNYEIPIIIDADGLNTLAKMNLEILNETKCKVILTPHLKEFERISKISIEEIKQNSSEYAIEFAKKHNCIVLLKGSTTTVTDGDITYLVKRGCPGMSTAGSGDVLSGILVGMLGYQKPEVLTIATGAYLAGLAGELAQAEKTDISMKASDTIDKISEAIKIIRNKS